MSISFLVFTLGTDLNSLNISGLKGFVGTNPSSRSQSPVKLGKLVGFGAEKALGSSIA